jgi:4'-phosphopantetheinyl transferase
MSQIKISNRLLSETCWENIAGFDFSINSRVDIWRINISSNLSFLESLSPLLTHDELARASRYIHLHDSNRFKISRGALKLIMGRYLNRQPSLVEVVPGINKKPYIKNSTLFYNISHSGDWIVLAVSDSAIGVDTEQVNPSFDFNDVIKEYFSLEEARSILEEKSPDRFFMIWTRKEALTKATGKGLDEDLKFIPGLDGDHYIQGEMLSSSNSWLITSFKLSANYFASVASTYQAAGLRFWETDLRDKIFTYS